MTKEEKQMLTHHYFHTIRTICFHYGCGEIETAREMLRVVSHPMYLVEGEDFQMWDNKVLRDAIATTGHDFDEVIKALKW